MQDRFALDAFIDALNNSDMEWAVHPFSLQDASKVAHEYEAFRTGRGRKNFLVRGEYKAYKKKIHFSHLGAKLAHLGAKLAHYIQ